MDSIPDLQAFVRPDFAYDTSARASIPPRLADNANSILAARVARIA
jgi:hypothetical protein